jgi:hypothetical protein
MSISTVVSSLASRKFFLLVGIVIFILINGGCIGMVARNIEKGDSGNYSQLKPSMPSLPPDMGRLVLYMIDGAPNVGNTIGVIEACTIDNYAYKFMSQTYWYVDLPKGPHRVTATDVKSGFSDMPKYYGKEILDIDLKEGEIQFIKINMAGTTLIGRFNTYTPVLVSQEIAESELANLDFYKNFKTNIIIK